MLRQVHRRSDVAETKGGNIVNLRRSVVLAGAVALSMQASAGGDKVAFPTGFEKGTLYAVVDRPDSKQYRELYASPGVVDAVRKGQGVPSGAVLTLVQYKAQVDAKGAPSIPTRSATANGSTRPLRRTGR